MSTDPTSTLIIEVFIRTPLWDTENEDYFKEEVVEKLWQEVANELSSTKEVVKDRWKELYSDFEDELLQVTRERDANATFNPIVCSDVFNLMFFLKDVIMKKDPDDSKVKKDSDPKSQTLNINGVQDEPVAGPSRPRKRSIVEITLDSDSDSEDQPGNPATAENGDEDFNFLMNMLPVMESISLERKQLLRESLQNILFSALVEDDSPATI